MKKYLIIIIILALFTRCSQELGHIFDRNSSGSISVPGDWYDASWARRVKLTFDNSAQSENLVNFPVLVKLDSSRIDYTSIEPDGADIRFVDSDGSTLLDYEIEEWNEGGNSFIWVRVPQVDGSSSTDFIWIYYGNNIVVDDQDPNGVWNSGFKGVWHLKEDPGSGNSGDILDSTINGNDGTAEASMDTADHVTGQIGDAIDFDGTDDNIEVADSVSLHDFTDKITVEAWIKPELGSSGWRTIVSKFDQPGDVKDLYFMMNNNSLGMAIDAPQPTDWIPGVSISTAAWTYVVFTYDGSDEILYKDSINLASASVSGSLGLSGNTNPLYIAYNSVWGEVFQGTIDELRISNVARSADWISAQYESMQDNFITYSVEGSIE